ncbi:hypothetical protein P692DRAFT_20838908 [Suillus brevipes Sb2]|nr:hypothetical protein P692DRAFT_20838908 [Suillus brevipes Sb2]
MRFSSAYVLAVAAALVSSVSATPIDAGAEWCGVFCYKDSQCNCDERVCLVAESINVLVSEQILLPLARLRSWKPLEWGGLVGIGWCRPRV